MNQLLSIAVVMMILGAAMLIAGYGAPALWIGVVTVGIAWTAIDVSRRRDVSS